MQVAMQSAYIHTRTCFFALEYEDPRAFLDHFDIHHTLSLPPFFSLFLRYRMSKLFLTKREAR